MSQPSEHGGNVLSLTSRLGLAPGDLADFSASINPLGLPDSVREAVMAALGTLVHYPDTACTELTQILAESHGLSPDQVAVANGSTEIIYRLPAFLPGNRALIVAPTFSEYGLALEQQHWQVRHLILKPDDRFTLDLDLLSAEMSGCDALYLCNPGNPSGTLYPPALVERIVALCRAAGTFLVLDEAFMDFCEESSAKASLVDTQDGLVLRSMTKFYGIPGLRLGYALGHPALIERLSGLGGPWSVNTLAQVAGAAALRDRDYRERSLAFVRDERRWLQEQFAKMPALTLFDSQANFLLLRIEHGPTAPEVQSRLLQEKILIRDCSSFIGLSNRYFRIAVRTRQENGRLVDCLRRIFP